MSSLDIAPHPESAPVRVQDRYRTRHRLRVSFRRAGICTIWRLGFRQFSFHHIARVPRRTVPDTWTRPPVSCHALVPLTFRRQVRHQTQGNPSNPSRLSRGYDEAPRGAPLSCRRADAGRTAAGLAGQCHVSAETWHAIASRVDVCFCPVRTGTRAHLPWLDSAADRAAPRSVRVRDIRAYRHGACRVQRRDSSPGWCRAP
jgi:hypothetical protein